MASKVLEFVSEKFLVPQRSAALHTEAGRTLPSRSRKRTLQSAKSSHRSVHAATPHHCRVDGRRGGAMWTPRNRVEIAGS